MSDMHRQAHMAVIWSSTSGYLWPREDGWAHGSILHPVWWMWHCHANMEQSLEGMFPAPCLKHTPGGAGGLTLHYNGGLNKMDTTLVFMQRRNVKDSIVRKSSVYFDSSVCFHSQTWLCTASSSQCECRLFSISVSHSSSTPLTFLCRQYTQISSGTQWKADQTILKKWLNLFESLYSRLQWCHVM